MDLFNKHGFNPRGDLGQNFLIDINIIEFIVEEAELTADDVVLEVGSGTGGMTTFMGVAAGHVVSVEYDNNMYGLAKAQTANFDNITLMNLDALKNKNQIAPEVIAEVQKQLDAKPGRRLKMVANLPYNIATPLISNLVATELPWEKIVATIQLELAERMASSPGVSKYGSLATWLQAQAKVKVIKRMPPTIFWPRPKVDSAVVKIAPQPEKRAKIDDRVFIRTSFVESSSIAASICGAWFAGCIASRLRKRRSMNASLRKASLRKFGRKNCKLPSSFRCRIRSKTLSCGMNDQLAHRSAE